MKPLELKLTAFGPYKDTEKIDFQQLKGQNLFVISGNTGSGKTTIFDGICFALYGSASGQDRENQAMLRSDFSDDDTHTAVELIFSLKNKTYRILRQLGHIKTGNKSKTGDQYEFYEIVEDREIPAVDRQIVSEINEKVETLIGLTQDQFKQIVMLPQGEFRKLLTSETENKEHILRRLFKTYSYQQINEQLRIRKQQNEQIYNEAHQLLNNYIHQLRGSLPVREGVTLFQLLDEPHANIHQLLTGLQAEIQHYKEQVTVDQAQYEVSFAAHDKKQKQYHQAQTTNERFVELDQKKKTWQSLRDQAQSYKAKSDQLEQANRAYELLPYEKQKNDSGKYKQQKIDQMTHAKKTYEQAETHVNKSKTQFEQGERDQSLRDDVKQQLNRLREYVPTVKDINRSEKDLASEKKRVSVLHEQLGGERKKLGTSKTTSKKHYETLESLEKQVNDLPEQREKLLAMREQMQLLKKYQALLEQLNSLKMSYKTEFEKLKQLQVQYDAKEQLWLNNQASLLANHLHEGDACPVCGSVEHPRKALADEHLVKRDELDALKKQLDVQDGTCRNIKADGQAKKKQLQETVEEMEKRDMSKENVSNVLEELVKDGKELRGKVDELEGLRKKLSQTRTDYHEEKKREEQLDKTIQKLDAEYSEQQTIYEKNQAVFTERLRVIPEAVRDLSALHKQITALEDKQNKLEATWKKVNEHYQLAREQKATAETNVSQAEKQLQEATEKTKASTEQFEDALQKASFHTQADYEAAKLSESARTELKSNIEQYNQMMSITGEQVKELTELLHGKNRMNLTQLTNELAEVKKAYENALNAWNQSKENMSVAKILKENISKSQEQLQKVERQLSVVTDIYDVVRGQNSKKISFERYLQIEYLERIIHAANERLKILSNGQFLLMRSDRQESHGKQSGLALDVYDGYTGQTRDVKTLSGGEKFNASLCLALGMSDVIQSFEGNISIQTMFIDEGFGSLDEESLNKSIETLIDLQASGRMIGVISHVQELKTIFPAVLEVKKTSEGHSHTQFKVY